MMWNERYSQSSYAYGTEPNDFLLTEYMRIVPGGRVLCLAEGQGRNAVFLARHGYAVTAVDQSSVGLRRAQELAHTQGVQIETLTANLSDFDLGLGWDGIISIFGHTPPHIRRRVHEAIPRALRKGGVYILEAYNPRQPEMPGRGGPPAEQRDFFMSLKDLREEMSSLEFVIGREVEREVNEGSCHQGLSAVVQIVAVNN